MLSELLLPPPLIFLSSPLVSMERGGGERLIEVAEAEVVIEFRPGVKCRSDVHLRSLHPTTAVSFKVQTSSPHKFHVNPPSGVLPPLSSLSLHVILRPQPHPPTSFPRSPSDRFLIRSSVLSSSYDIKLRVAYVGPFLLRLAASQGNAAAACHILRRQPSLLPRLPPEASADLLLVASSSPDLLNLLHAGLNVPTPTTTKPPPPTSSAAAAATAKGKGWTPLHSAAAFGEYDDLTTLTEEKPAGGGVDPRDTEGRTPLHLAAGKGYTRCVTLLAERGADKDATSRDGRTALHRAAATGDAEMVAALLELGANAGLASARGRTPLDVARERGHQEVVEILERGEMVMTAARRGDLRWLETLLEWPVGLRGRDQYGLTALHAAAVKGHRGAVAMLVEAGMDVGCRDAEGHTPLHLAVEGGWVETAELLIEMGAEVDAKSKRGATPLCLARAMGYEAISQLLLSRGAASSSFMASASSSSSTVCH